MMRVAIAVVVSALVCASSLAQERAAKQQKQNASQKKVVDWDAKYQQFLKDNPGVKSKVDSGAITKQQVLAGLKARQKETDKGEDLEAKYQIWLERNAKLRKAVADGQLSKKDLMEKLAAMIQKGELPWERGKNKKQRALAKNAKNAKNVRRGEKWLRRERKLNRLALQEQLGEFVKIGKLTKKDAEVLLNTAFPIAKQGAVDPGRRRR